MLHAILTLAGWGLFYGGLLLYIVWVIGERTFFAGTDPERWDPQAHDVIAVAQPGAPVRFSSATSLGRAG
jgi:hypothetical protein